MIAQNTCRCEPLCNRAGSMIADEDRFKSSRQLSQKQGLVQGLTADKSGEGWFRRAACCWWYSSSSLFSSADQAARKSLQDRSEPRHPRSCLSTCPGGVRMGRTTLTSSTAEPACRSHKCAGYSPESKARVCSVSISQQVE